MVATGRPEFADDVWPLVTSSDSERIFTLSEFLELQPGDLIMTGTPSGVNAISRGDVMTGRFEGVGEISIRVV